VRNLREPCFSSYKLELSAESRERPKKFLTLNKFKLSGGAHLKFISPLASADIHFNCGRAASMAKPHSLSTSVCTRKNDFIFSPNFMGLFFRNKKIWLRHLARQLKSYRVHFFTYYWPIGCLGALISWRKKWAHMSLLFRVKNLSLQSIYIKYFDCWLTKEFYDASISDICDISKRKLLLQKTGQKRAKVRLSTTS